jgi:predicted nucleic acid-binding protein
MRLYDSDYCISFMRGKVGLPPGSAAQTLGAIRISVITLFELWTGVHKCSQPAKELQKLNHFLIGTTTMAIDDADARRAARAL